MPDIGAAGTRPAACVDPDATIIAAGSGMAREDNSVCSNLFEAPRSASLRQLNTHHIAVDQLTVHPTVRYGVWSHADEAHATVDRILLLLGTSGIVKPPECLRQPSGPVTEHPAQRTLATDQ